jgi:polysaccharide export outer membrane protein
MVVLDRRRLIFTKLRLWRSIKMNTDNVEHVTALSSRFAGLIFFAVFLGLTSTASAENPAQHKDEGGSRLDVSGTKKSTEAGGEDFVIGPGDVLNISVWKEPELSKTIPVRPDGKISLPLLNDLQASGLTALQLKDSLSEKLKRFVAEPSVTVTVETVNSKKVIITGEVSGPGPRSLTGPTRLMDVLAVSGFTPFAKKSKIYVVRTEGDKQQRFNFNYKDYLKGKNPEQNVLLKSGDMIIVP